jgi:hypothetical protein
LSPSEFLHYASNVEQDDLELHELRLALQPPIESPAPAARRDERHVLKGGAKVRLGGSRACPGKERNVKEEIALVSDLAIFVLLAIFVARS